MKSFLKLCFINLIILMSLLGFVSYTVPLWVFIGNAVSSHIINYERGLEKASLPNYKDIDWVNKHFYETENLSKSIYNDYTIYRRNAFHGETINIDENGIRKTTNTNPRGEKVFFFGGSTMWGTGSNDENTIPLLFSKITHVNAINFGETGWTTHQSLYMLQKLYVQGERPDIVVFYSGVNEISKCRSELTFFSSGREMQIRNSVIPDYIYSYAYLFEPVKRFLSISGNEDSLNKKIFDCDRNPVKARAIAVALYIDFLSAKHLV